MRTRKLLETTKLSTNFVYILFLFFVLYPLFSILLSVCGHVYVYASSASNRVCSDTLLLSTSAHKL
ncbi:hypothetical protein EON65_19435 [archaeon]|nr:MAG: hypothetical protein EON65_19435 [archaeon]